MDPVARRPDHQRDAGQRRDADRARACSAQGDASRSAARPKGSPSCRSPCARLWMSGDPGGTGALEGPRPAGPPAAGRAGASCRGCDWRRPKRSQAWTPHRNSSPGSSSAGLGTEKPGIQSEPLWTKPAEPRASHRARSQRRAGRGVRPRLDGIREAVNPAGHPRPDA